MYTQCQCVSNYERIFAFLCLFQSTEHNTLDQAVEAWKIARDDRKKRFDATPLNTTMIFHLFIFSPFAAMHLRR